MSELIIPDRRTRSQEIRAVLVGSGVVNVIGIRSTRKHKAIDIVLPAASHLDRLSKRINLDFPFFMSSNAILQSLEIIENIWQNRTVYRVRARFNKGYVSFNAEHIINL